MFKDRAFNLSILFSVGWHLFWISVIGIVVTPSVQPSNVYQEVDFLGPILEKTAFDLMAEGIKPHAETLYARSTLFLDQVYLKPKGPRRKVLKEFIPDTIFDRFTFTLRDCAKGAKEIPLGFDESIRMARDETKSGASASVEGPAGKREIVFKPPDPPAVPRGLYSDAEEYAVSLKFFLSEGGVVYDVEPVVSSGYPEVDLRAIRFLKRWRFSPFSVVEKEKSTWGIVSVRIEAK